jgi:hypothetical protein
VVENWRNDRYAVIRNATFGLPPGQPLHLTLRLQLRQVQHISPFLTYRSLMPKCRCRTDAVDWREKCRCQTNFFPSLRRLLIKHQIARGNCVWYRVHPFPPPAVWTRKGYPFPPSKKSSKFRNARLSGIRSVQYRNEQKCRCQNQSEIVIRRPGPEPECCGTGLRCWNSDASILMPVPSYADKT